MAGWGLPWTRSRRARPQRSDVPLVLLHGMSSSARAWDPLLPFLDEREVVVLTLPGHRGGEPTVVTSTAEYVDAVEAELDRRGIAEADLVGNSLGGWIALQLAGRGRARSVVCLAPAGGWAVGGTFDRILTAQFSLGYRACRRLVLPSGERLLRHPRVKRAVLHPVVARPELVGDRQLDDVVHDIAGCTAVPVAVGLPGARDVATVPVAPCPVLIAWSERDRVLRSRASRRRLEAQVGRPVVVRLPGVGHVPMNDDPFLVATTILEFTGSAVEDQPA